MAEQNPGVYLNDAERDALKRERLLNLAQALQMQALLLLSWGIDEKEIQAGVDQMRNQLQNASDADVKKMGKTLFRAVELLGEPQTIAPVVALPAVELKQMSGAQESINDPFEVIEPVETETQIAPIQEGEENVDGRGPNKLAPQLNAVFKKVFTLEQRAGLLGLDASQKEAFVKLFGDIIIEHGHSGQKMIAPQHTEKLALFLEGHNAEEIGRLLNVHPSTVSSPFRNSLAKLMYEHKHQLVTGYEKILAMGPGVLQEEGSAQQEKVISVLPQKPAKERIVHPEGIDSNVDNALARVLDFERRAEIVEFRPDQLEALGLLVDNILRKVITPEKGNADLWSERFKKLLGGKSIREIASEEEAHYMGIVKGFTTIVPASLASFSDEFVNGFEKIRLMVENAQHTEPESNIGIESPAVNSIQVFNDELFGGNSDGAAVTDNAEQEGYASRNVEAGGTAETAVDEQSIEEPVKQESETMAGEPLVELMQKLYAIEDPVMMQAIDDLFSTNRGVIYANEHTTKAAQHLSKWLQNKGINPAIILENSMGRDVAMRLLSGTKRDDQVYWSTLSEMIDATPEALRQKKLDATQKAFEKLAKMLGGEKSVPVDKRADRIANLRKELPQYIGVDREQTSRIIDRAIGASTDYDGALCKALTAMLKEVAGSLNDQLETNIIRYFASPRGDTAPRTIEEIAQYISDQEKAKGGRSVKTYEAADITNKLLRIFERHITQRKDG